MTSEAEWETTITLEAETARSRLAQRNTTSSLVEIDLESFGRALSVRAHLETTSQTSALRQTPKLFLSENGRFPKGSFRSFCTDDLIHYHPLCDDFGPMNMLCIIQFFRTVEEEIRLCMDCGCQQLVYSCKPGRRAFTNAAFLIGSYVILKTDLDPDKVNQMFKDVTPDAFEYYRDATYAVPDFRLLLIDCWQGLHRAKSIGWIALPSISTNTVWGEIDSEEYAHYDSPLNGDLHTVVPNKFVAFRGPKDLGGPTFLNNYHRQSREFDPKFYVDIFEEMNVTTVIRLNEVLYSPSVFVDHGIEHHDLYFDDCTSPPPKIVKKFLNIVDKAKGLVAIHCKAGLGRTGTLIALYMMRSYGFSAREAVGWLRVMRPGSIIGDQQHFLCKVDQGLCTRAAAGRLPRSPASAASWALRASAGAAGGGAAQAAPAGGEVRRSASAAHLAEQVSEGMRRRDMTGASRGGLMQSHSGSDIAGRSGGCEVE